MSKFLFPFAFCTAVFLLFDPWAFSQITRDAPGIHPRDPNLERSDSETGSSAPVAPFSPSSESLSDSASPESAANSSPSVPVPVEEPKPTEPKTETTTPIPTLTEAPPSDLEAEKLHEQLLVLDKAKKPDELFQYLRSTHQERNYRAAAFAMAFGKTKYATPTLQRNCLAKWIYIIDRMEDLYPEDFPLESNTTERLFHLGDSYERLDFVKDPGSGCWQLGPQSIAKTDELYGKVQGRRPLKGDLIARNIPEWMFGNFLGLSYYSWSVLGLGFALGWVVYWVIQNLLYMLMRAYMKVVYHEETRLSRGVGKQLGAIFMAWIWFKTYSTVVLSPTMYGIGYYLFLCFTTFFALMIAMKIVDLLAASLRIRMINKYSDANVDNLIIPLFSRSFKAVVLCLGAISLAQSLHLPIVGILSGMGIGGVAIAFAAKETVGNFFGSITVLIDKPFDIGDWIVTDGVEGTVEAVGMRSTRIRTFYNSVITIPNNNLTTAVIDNMGRRRYRRFRTFLALQYENGPDRIEVFCAGIMELIEKNPFTLKENYSVSLYNLQPNAIEVLLNVFFECPSTQTENRERAKLLGSILKLAQSLDVRFAYPTQRLLLNSAESPDFKELEGEDFYRLGKTYAEKVIYPEGK